MNPTTTTGSEKPINEDVEARKLSIALMSQLITQLYNTDIQLMGNIDSPQSRKITSKAINIIETKMKEIRDMLPNQKWS